MPQYDANRLDLADEVRTSLAIENTLSALQARSYVRCLQTTWKVPTIAWREQESKNQFEDARRLLHTAGIFEEIEGATSQHAVECYRRAGELLEWLSRAVDSIRTSAPIELYAAAAYQLGNLPAMANGLLSQVNSLDEGSRLYSCFLRADFDGVLQTVAKFWQQNPDLTERDASSNLLAEEADDKISWYIVVELVRTLGLAADSLRRGNDERLQIALQKLSGLNNLALRTTANDTSLLISLIYAVAKTFKDASVYKWVLQLASANPRFTNRLRKFARVQYNKGRGVLWSSQQHGLDRLLNESSFALCTPTGSGKTLVANVALIKELLLTETESPLAPLGLYLVPSRALAGEVEAKLRGELGQDFIITGLYGGADWGITDYWLNADRATILIATVEKADALMRYLGSFLLARLRLLIVDEAHQVVSEESEYAKHSFAEHSSRPLRLESFVSRLLVQLPDVPRIALTAVAGGAAFPIARWIEGRPDAVAVGTHYRSTRQVLGKFETRPGNSGAILLELMNDRSLYVRGRDDAVYINLTTPQMPQLPASMRNSVYRFNELNVLWTALHLIEGQRRILISVTQAPEKTMGWCAEALALPGWKSISFFELPEDEVLRATFYEARNACVDYCGPKSYELTLLDCGIATNHGQMPQRLRRLMTGLIDRGICPITIATSTLTEGVNLPFDLIFLTSLKRTAFEPTIGQQVISPLSTSEFRNLSGRAGRPGSIKGLEGMTLVAVPQRPSTTAQSQLATQRKQINELNNDYGILMETLSNEELHDTDIKSPLSLLIESIAELADSVLDIEGEEFLEWLDKVTPNEISEEGAGNGTPSARSRLADSLDELDGFLLTALEELAAFQSGDFDRATTEIFLASLWQRTFANVAAANEDWLEEVVVRRGCALHDEVYSDPAERKRLYQYGFTPNIGRRFEAIASQIVEIIERADEYGEWSSEERLGVFKNLGDLLAQDSGFGFHIRDSEKERQLLENRDAVLAWWMKAPGAEQPEPKHLRAWQGFVSNNWEFKVGTAVGAVISQAWSDGNKGELVIPSLEAWKETTGLPWFGFWAKELLRWGTLEPFVAFALAQGLAHTRTEGEVRRLEFDIWLRQILEDVTPDDQIDPQRFLEWQRSLPQQESVTEPERFDEVLLTGSTGQLHRYQVIPVVEGGAINWIDASGFSLAKSKTPSTFANINPVTNDYELVVGTGKNGLKIERTF